VFRWRDNSMSRVLLLGRFRPVCQVARPPITS
jgi:hypothetical protein